MKQLLKYFKHYKWASFFGPTFKLVEALLELSVPMLVAAIIDQAIPSGEMNQVLRYIAIMFGVAVLGMAFSLTAQYCSAKAAVGFTKELGSALFHHIIHLPKKEQDSVSSSSLVTRMTSDLFQIQAGLNLFFRLFLRSPFVVAGSFIMAVNIDRRMTLYFLGMIVLLTIVVVGVLYLSTPLHKTIREDLDQLVTLTREQIQGIRVIRAFRQEDKEIKSFRQQNKRLADNQIKVGRLNVLTGPLTYVIVNVTLILVIWQGGFYINAGSLTQGQLVALVNYLLAILIELVKIAHFVMQLNRGLSSARRVVEVMEREVESEEFEHTTAAEFSKQAFAEDIALMFNDVSYTYPEANEPSLRNLDFVIQAGDFVGVTGSTGSGKTTLISLITKSYDPTTGQVNFNPQLFDVTTRRHLRERVSVVPQRATLFHGTIRSNLLQGKPDATDAEMWQALDASQASEFVRNQAKGLDAPVEAFGRNFSGGQRQRLTIARALIKPAQILILDAATSALDYVTEANFQRVLHEQYQHLTVIMVSERTHSIQAADQIIVLDEGRQIGLGSHAELLENNNIYREIYNSQQVLEAT